MDTPGKQLQMDISNIGPSRLVTIAICMISASSLAYEIILLRQLAYGVGHLFASMTISLALLGIGAGGTFLTLFRSTLAERFQLWMPLGAAGFSFSVIVCPFLAFRLGFTPDSFMWDSWQFVRLAGLYGLLSIPFFFSGGCIGLALSVKHKSPDHIYRADLLGAGAGGAAVLACLSFLPPETAMKAVSLISILAATLFLMDSFRKSYLLAMGFILASAGILSILPGSALSPPLSPYKPLNRALLIPESSIVEETTGLWGRCVAVKSPKIPIRHAPGLSLFSTSEPPEQIALFSNGDPNGIVTRFDGSMNSLAFFDALPTSLPYLLFKAPSVLVLKAGGGFHVLEAIRHGARQVEAVEANDDLNKLTDRLGAFSGDIFEKAEINRSPISPRALLRRTDEQFDIIITPTGSGSGSVAPVAENYLMTMEGITDMLNRLTPHGILMATVPIENPDRTGFRTIATAIAVLKEQGISPEAKIALVLSPTTATVLVSRESFTKTQTRRMQSHCDEWGFSLVVPGSMPQPADNYDAARYAAVVDTLIAPQASRFISDYPWDITPPTDDRPFFNVHFKTTQLHEMVALLQSGAMALVDWGWVLLLATLGIAVCFSTIFILFPLLPIGRRALAGRQKLWTFTYFGSLGFAFMLLELVSIKKLAFCLGNPVVAAGCIISTFLIFAGLGAGVSRKICSNNGKYGLGIQAAVLGILISCSIVLLFLPTFQSWIARLPVIPQYVLGALVFGPTAFFMGMPFPLGLCLLSDDSAELIPWAWAVNGCASVVSPLLALMLAVNFGFLATAFLAMGLYVLSALTVVLKSVFRTPQE